MLLALVLSLGVGFGGGYAARQVTSSSEPSFVLAPPGGSTTAPPTSVLPDSTLGLGTEVPVTTAAPVDTTVPPPVVTDAPPAQIKLGTGGALFSPSSDRRLFDPVLGCDSFTQTQGAGSSGGCDRFNVGNVEVAWSVDTESAALDVLWRDPAANEPDVWNLGLRADASEITRQPRVGDVTGDGKQDIVVGATSGGSLLVDVVELNGAIPTVTLHLDLPGGRVRLGAGELHVWRAVDGSPDQLEHIVLTRSGGGWQANGRELVKAISVGSSQV